MKTQKINLLRSLFLSTGRFLVQGKLYEEWSLNEFPILLFTVNSIQSLDMLDTSKDKLLFASSMSTFFKALSISSQMTASQHLLKQPQSLSLTPNRLNTIATLRTTVRILEADFTQFKMSISNEIQQLKDKQVHQDNHLKRHKQISDGISSDLSLHIDNVNGEFMKQTKQLKKLQNDNQALHKKYSLIFEAHTNLSAQYEQLQAEVTFLKDQIGALW